jgi:hypothetical protein
VVRRDREFPRSLHAATLLAKFQMPKSKLQTNPNIKIQNCFWSLIF